MPCKARLVASYGAIIHELQEDLAAAIDERRDLEERLTGVLSQVTAAREARDKAEEERAAGIVLASALAKAPRPPPPLLHPSQPSSPPRRRLARLADSMPSTPPQPVVHLVEASPWKAELANCPPPHAYEAVTTTAAVAVSLPCREVGSPVSSEETVHSEQSTWRSPAFGASGGIAPAPLARGPPSFAAPQEPQPTQGWGQSHCKI